MTYTNARIAGRLLSPLAGRGTVRGLGISRHELRRNSDAVVDDRGPAQSRWGRAKACSGRITGSGASSTPASVG
jgi:hypothetical protein